MPSEPRQALTPRWPCPICGHELAPRPIPPRNWLLHPFASLRHRRYDRQYPMWHLLINHGQTTSLHALSPTASISWASPNALRKIQLQDRDTPPERA